jgi:hypothetical protein
MQQLQLLTYTDHELSMMTLDELISLMERDEDRVPRNVIDECARRGDAMLDALQAIVTDDQCWDPSAPPGKWRLLVHAVMILGLIPSDGAGALLVTYMEKMSREDDYHLQDMFAGTWPLLFANKSESAEPAIRGLVQDRTLDCYMRENAVQVLLAFAARRDPESLDAELDRLASLAADKSESLRVRVAFGDVLCNFPRVRHRSLLESLTDVDAEVERFDLDEIEDIYVHPEDAPEWEWLPDPWRFYSAEARAARQEDWQDEDDLDFDDESDFLLHDEVETYVRATPKVGRNDPCPCGSGKKYKKCCLGKDADDSSIEI